MKKKSDYKIVCIIYSSLLLLLSRFSCVRPHRWQPTRLPRPWDSPGKNTGVSCHFLLQCRKVKSESEVAQSRPTLSDPINPETSLSVLSLTFRKFKTRRKTGFLSLRVLLSSCGRGSHWCGVPAVLGTLLSTSVCLQMMLPSLSLKDVLAECRVLC